jgi:hypothetical protein
MATPEEIQKLLKDLDRVYKDLGTKNPFANFDASKVSDASSAVQILNSGLRDAKRELDDINGDLNETIIGFKKTVDEIKNTNSGLSLANKTFSGLSDLTRKLKSDQAGINELSGKELKNIQSQAKEKREDLKVSKDLLTSRIAELKELEKKEPLNAKQKKELTESISASKAVKNELREQDTLSTLINGKLNQRIAQETRIEKLLGLGGAAVAGTKAALDKLGFGGLANALGLDEVQEKMRKVADEIEKSEGYTGGFSDKMKVLKAGISEAGIQFKQSLKDPAAIATLLIKEMISALQGADKATGELAKSFGTSYSEASSLRNELNTVANLSGDVNVNTAALQKSLVAINKEFGTASKLNGELLKDFTQLTTVAGYTEEAALGLSKITAATGTDLSDNTEAILGEAAALNAVNRLALNEKEIVEEVAKASAATTLTLGMQPKELTKAVVQAKALGVTLEQVESISQSLLNFESSISAELEAELLTGKNLNLEKARLAALNGDIATVAEEIAKQTGSAADFTKMNVIQQEALAKSVGMTREDLAKSLIEREALANIGAKDAEEAKKRFDLLVKNYGYEEATKRLGDEKYAQQLRSQSVQERFNASVEKLREIFISIAEPVLQIVSPFMDLATKILPLVNIALFPIINGIKVVSDLILYVVDSVKALAGALTGSNKELTVMQGIVGSIAAAYLAYQGYIIATNVVQGVSAALSERKALAENASLIAVGAQKAAEAAGMGLKAASAVLSGTKAIAEVTAAEAISFGLVTLAIIGGLAAVVSAMNNSKKGNDVVSQGYGKRTLMAPEGAIQLNDKDTVIAGTNLGGGSNQSANTSSPSINLSPLVERMAAVENLLGQILSKEGTVFLDGNKVGTAMAMGTYKTQ